MISANSNNTPLQKDMLLNLTKEKEQKKQNSKTKRKIWIDICVGVLIILFASIIIYLLCVFYFQTAEYISRNQVQIQRKIVAFALSQLSSTSKSSQFCDIQNGYSFQHPETFSDYFRLWNEQKPRTDKKTHPLAVAQFKQVQNQNLNLNQKNQIQKWLKKGRFSFFLLHKIHQQDVLFRNRNNAHINIHLTPSWVFTEIVNQSNWLIYLLCWQKFKTVSEKKWFLSEIEQKYLTLQQNYQESSFFQIKSIQKFLFFLISQKDPLILSFIETKKNSLNHPSFSLLNSFSRILYEFAEVSQLSQKVTCWLELHILYTSVATIVVQYLTPRNFTQFLSLEEKKAPTPQTSRSRNIRSTPSNYLYSFIIRSS